MSAPWGQIGTRRRRGRWHRFVQVVIIVAEAKVVRWTAAGQSTATLLQRQISWTACAIFAVWVVASVVVVGGRGSSSGGWNNGWAFALVKEAALVAVRIATTTKRPNGNMYKCFRLPVEKKDRDNNQDRWKS